MLESYAGALAFAATEAYIAGQYRASRLIRVPFSFNLVNLEAINRIGNYKYDLITKGGSVIDGEFKPWLRDMGKTARDRVAQVVEEGIRNGTPLREIRSKLDEVFEMQEHKSELVAYQETRRLFNQGTMDRFSDEGIQEFVWHHMDPQEHPRLEHQSWDGKVFTFDTLPSLDEYNCHCWVEPVTGHKRG
jgi:SPP1 gp7 family putative phage head morphogenesis protein